MKPHYALALLVGTTAALLWSYWPTLAAVEQRWAHDPQYSHGYLVPAFALVLLSVRRQRFDSARARPSAWGVPFLLAGVFIRLTGTYFYFPWLDALSLLPSLAGLVLVLGGWQAFGWAWPSVAFLAFMLPLPYRVETALSQPLRQVSTLLSTYVLQTVGFSAIADGNIIIVGNYRIGVAEACNGLSMLVTFVAMTTAVALLSRRHWIDKVVLVCSAVPVALAANVARIAVTAMANEWLGAKQANAVFHDWAGWLMMPFALAILAAELCLLSHLFVEPETGRRPLPVDLPVDTKSPANAQGGRAVPV